VPGPVPEGIVPLISVEGSAYACGRAYARIVMDRYPNYRRYLDQASSWRSLHTDVRRLFEQRAPYMLDVYRGLLDVAGPPRSTPKPDTPAKQCTSFGVAGDVTLDGEPISGQTKDTGVESALLYIVLRMRIEDGPTLLVLAYPGEVLGYGLWSTGMSLFRNNLYSTAGAERGLTMEQWGLLALAGGCTDEAVFLACKYGIRTVGNFLVSDRRGRSVNVESNVGGVSVVPARKGIATHANHPVGDRTAPHEHYPDEAERVASRHRMDRLWQLLDVDRGLLAAPKAMMCLADHAGNPRGICRHFVHGGADLVTTGAVVAEPTRGRLHVTRSNPCSNWPTSYML